MRCCASSSPGRGNARYVPTVRDPRRDAGVGLTPTPSGSPCYVRHRAATTVGVTWSVCSGRGVPAPSPGAFVVGGTPCPAPGATCPRTTPCAFRPVACGHMTFPSRACAVVACWKPYAAGSSRCPSRSYSVRCFYGRGCSPTSTRSGIWCPQVRARPSAPAQMTASATVVNRFLRLQVPHRRQQALTEGWRTTAAVGPGSPSPRGCDIVDLGPSVCASAVTPSQAPVVQAGPTSTSAGGRAWRTHR